MQDPLPITPVTIPIHGRICPPGSKSITNRALIVAALANGTSTLTGVLDSVDTQVMTKSLRSLGITIDHDTANCTMTVHGCGGRIPSTGAELRLENSGTSIRFLTAMCALGEGTFRLDGNERMRERPIEPLLDALRQLGVNATSIKGTNCPPVEVQATGIPGGKATVAGNLSSQYLSALLMASGGRQPVERSDNDVTLKITGNLVSRPYIDMTIQVMQSFGVNIEGSNSQEFRIPPQQYQATDYPIEPDASAASYFFAAAAITGGEVTVEGLTPNALQGDVKFVDVLEQMGCTVSSDENSTTVSGRASRGVQVDMNAISDTVQTLAAVAVFADGPTVITNVGHIRHKETDRIDAVANELRRMNIKVDTTADGLTIHPGTPQPAVIQTYDDHRMAMSFALVGLRANGIQIADPQCTSKTYPGYFGDLENLVGGL